MIEVRCKGCDKLLAMAESMNAAIKCPRCKRIFEYKIFSNLFMTNQINPKDLRKKKEDDTISLESNETTPRG